LFLPSPRGVPFASTALDMDTYKTRVLHQQPQERLTGLIRLGKHRCASLL
jgi:hypothetical protein